MAEYTFDVQKLYLEMMLADAESYARAQNIFDPNSFDRKLQPIAKFIKDYSEEYKVLPEVEQVNAKHDIKLKTAKDLDPSHFSWLLDEFETFSRHKALERAILQSADLLENFLNHFDIKFQKAIPKQLGSVVFTYNLFVDLSECRIRRHH